MLVTKLVAAARTTRARDDGVTRGFHTSAIDGTIEESRA
jgi:hypothetical protein